MLGTVDGGRVSAGVTWREAARDARPRGRSACVRGCGFGIKLASKDWCVFKIVSSGMTRCEKRRSTCVCGSTVGLASQR